MAPYITWKNYYSVGEPSIDAEHRQIIEFINEMYAAVRGKADHGAVKRLLDQLWRYTIDHFAHEEQMMLAHGYPGLAEHKAMHEKMRQRTAAWRENATLITGRDMLVFLKDWWSNHIQQQDKEYTPYLNAVTVG